MQCPHAENLERLTALSGRRRQRIVTWDQPKWNVVRASLRLEGGPLYKTGDVIVSSSAFQMVRQYWDRYKSADGPQDLAYYLRQHDRALLYSWSDVDSPLRKMVQPKRAFTPGPD